MHQPKTSARSRVKGQPSAKLANDRRWRTFLKNLSASARSTPGQEPEAREVNREAFARHLGIASRKARAWFNGEQWPNADGLRLVHEKTGDSIDWLLGLSPVRKAKDRERIGDLARELVVHVVRAYGASKYAEFGAGLADVLGCVTDRSTAAFASNQEVQDTKDGGFVVLLRPPSGVATALSVQDPSEFLRRVTIRAVRDADEWEADRDVTEADQIRRRCSDALAILASLSDDEVADRLEVPRAQIASALHSAASEPLTQESRAAVHYWGIQLHNTAHFLNDRKRGVLSAVQAARSRLMPGGHTDSAD